ncbi:sulfotransferase family cytosolic 1B member 1-like [Lingula anatina]|uniref:Sulfotransferase family cytosolic 1B member 1-like n=1 Tax=Lingula anatina TaxID=7574 RepID=A0A1S3ITJ1_LINAN|nr:sulfotransferase family cytosolic 1B member 1-like [Lingula anatina]|eukprot:XP_013400849.2 sulfotransferase family cytosolic 1B member 1-like [Lingula anatina]
MLVAVVRRARKPDLINIQITTIQTLRRLVVQIYHLTFQIARNARAGSTASCLIKGIQCKGMAGPNTRDIHVAPDDVAISHGRKLDGRFFYRYKNIILPRLCPSSSIEALGQKTFSDDDIIVLGYPRSGSTWTMDMVQMLINCDFSELERNTNFKFRVDALELDFAPAYNGTTYHKLLDTVRKPRQLRTHLAYDFLPLHMFHTKARFIHITRNPKDVLVSLFHFYRSNKDLLGQWPGTWAEYFDMFLNKELVYGDWFDHTRGFWERRHNSRMLTLRYEEMLSNPCETVQNLAEFLEIPKSDEDIAKIDPHRQ